MEREKPSKGQGDRSLEEGNNRQRTYRGGGGGGRRRDKLVERQGRENLGGANGGRT